MLYWFISSTNSNPTQNIYPLEFGGSSLGHPSCPPGGVNCGPGVLFGTIFGTDFIIPGSVTINDKSFTDDSFGHYICSPGQINCSPNGQSYSSFGFDQIIVGPVFVNPNSFPGSRFGIHSFNPGQVNCTFTGIASATSFGSFQVINDFLTIISPAGIIDINFGNPSFPRGGVNCGPSGFHGGSFGFNEVIIGEWDIYPMNILPPNINGYHSFSCGGIVFSPAYFQGNVSNKGQFIPGEVFVNIPEIPSGASFGALIVLNDVNPVLPHEHGLLPVPYKWEYKPPLGTSFNINDPLYKKLGSIWLFNENCGNTVYDQLNGTSAVFSGNINWVTGRNGPCLFFDGVSASHNSLLLPTTTINSSTASFSFWFYSEDSAINVHNDIIWVLNGSNAMWGMDVVNNLVNFYFSPSFTMIVNTPIMPNQWNHVVITTNGININLYLNGSLVNTTNSIATLSGNPTQIFIGNFTSLSESFLGMLDDYRFFNDILLPNEVSNLYQNSYKIYNSPQNRLVPFIYPIPTDVTVFCTSFINELIGNESIFPLLWTIIPNSINNNFFGSFSCNVGGINCDVDGKIYTQFGIDIIIPGQVNIQESSFITNNFGNFTCNTGLVNIIPGLSKTENFGSNIIFPDIVLVNVNSISSISNVYDPSLSTLTYIINLFGFSDFFSGNTSLSRGSVFCSVNTFSSNDKIFDLFVFNIVFGSINNQYNINYMTDNYVNINYVRPDYSNINFIGD